MFKKSSKLLVVIAIIFSSGMVFAGEETAAKSI